MKISLLSKLIPIFIKNEKMQFVVMDKLMRAYEIGEFNKQDEFAEHHWNLTNVRIKDTKHIGYMPYNYYYADIIMISEDGLVDVPDSPDFLGIEGGVGDVDMVYRRLLTDVAKANKIIEEHYANV